MKKILSAIIALMMTLALLTGAAFAENTSYDDIFTSRMIFRVDSMFFMLDYYGYAIAMPDGVIDCNEYGVNGNVIEEWVETMYFPIEGMNEEEIAVLDYNIQMSFAGVASEDFCEASYEVMNNYYKVLIRFTDLDVHANVHKLAEYGFVASGVDYLGIGVTEQNLMSQGYLKNE